MGGGYATVWWICSLLTAWYRRLALRDCESGPSCSDLRVSDLGFAFLAGTIQILASRYAAVHEVTPRCSRPDAVSLLNNCSVLSLLWRGGLAAFNRKELFQGIIVVTWVRSCY